MQYKIPQEVNVEDKIIGPFTLKGFGFVFAAVAVALICAVILTKTGLGFFPSLIIGAFFGSFFIIIGFIPFNGKPMYTFAFPLFGFITKPRQRVWKKEAKLPKDISQEAQTKKQTTETEVTMPIKQDLSSVEKQIEDISLVVDTGGAYGSHQPEPGTQDEPSDIFAPRREKVEKELEKAKKQVETNNKNLEPTVAEIASVDPEKKFSYEYPDTSKYKLSEKLNKEKK